MPIRRLTITLSLAAICMILIGASSCGSSKPEEETEDEGETNTPTAVTSAFTTNCTTCHDADGIGGTTATESDLIDYTQNNSFSTFLDLIRNNPPTNMTPSSAAVYSDAAAESEYAYFKAK